MSRCIYAHVTNRRACLDNAGAAGPALISFKVPLISKTLKWLFFESYRKASSFGLRGRSGYRRLPWLKRNARIVRQDYPSKGLNIRYSQWHGNAMFQHELLEPREVLVFSLQRSF